MRWKTRAIRLANRVLRRFNAQIVRDAELWRPTANLGRQPRGRGITAAALAPTLQVFSGTSVPAQKPFDFAVVMPTTLRGTIRDALCSVFEQDLDGSVQILVGIDASAQTAEVVAEVCRNMPDRQSVFCFYPGYSTSRRHGGLHPAWDGGAMRTVLSYLANSRRIAYLDDDNWWSPDHLSAMRDALEDADWAYAGRWFVHPSTRRPVCRDAWESVGPGQGMFAENGGAGWVDPNCLAIDKLACEAVLRWWSIPLRNSTRAMDADRNVFRILASEFAGRASDRHSVFYTLDETDQLHTLRLQRIGAAAYQAAGALASPTPPQAESPDVERRSRRAA